MIQSKITVGEVARPHGVGGTLKINPLTDDVRRFEKLKSVFVDDKEYAVSRVSVSQNGVFLTLEGVNDRNAAESFRGKDVQVSRENADVGKGRVLIVDVLGCEVFFEDGERSEKSPIFSNTARQTSMCSKKAKNRYFFPLSNACS